MTCCVNFRGLKGLFWSKQALTCTDLYKIESQKRKREIFVSVSHY